MADTADSAIKYVGVDGCKAGWIGVGLSDNGCAKVEVCEEFPSLVACFPDACVILVDVPIGLPEDGKPSYRACDEEARGLLKFSKRENSVFRVASRRFVKAAMENEIWGFGKVEKIKNRYSKAKGDLNRRFDGIGSFTSEEFHIIPKIDEVEKALLPCGQGVSSKIREAHPEVCFWALNKMLNKDRQLVSKHESLGFGQRLRIVNCWVCNAVDLFERVPRRENSKSPMVKPDDVLDALALAITAKIVSQNPERLGNLPKDPQPDSVGKMVYALPNNEGPQC